MNWACGYVSAGGCPRQGGHAEQREEGDMQRKAPIGCLRANGGLWIPKDLERG